MDLITSHICMTKDLGVHGNLFGGIMCSWIDEAGALYACTYCDTSRMVTVKINEMVFKKPVKQGQILRFYGEVLRMGESSITLNIEVKHHDPKTAEEVLVTHTDIVFVRIDENGNAVPISNAIKEKFKTTNILKK